MDSLIRVENLIQEFPVKQGILDSYKIKGNKLVREKKAVHAVNGVTFEIYPGEAFSLVGESGCGKSTTAKTIIRLLNPVSGHIYYRDQDISQLKARAMLPYRKKMQMIFQDPYASLDPQKTIKNIIMEPMLFHKTAETRDEAEEKCMELLQKVGIRPEQASRYPHQFSGGQRQRIGIARALAVEPEFIIADEPVSALDVSIQSQVLNLLKDLQERYGLTYLFISHDLSVVKFIADRVCVMFLGNMCEIGDTEELYGHPLHPYTRFLLNAIPKADPRLRSQEKELLSGEIPSPVNPPPGCRFHTRCPYAKDICRQKAPECRKVGERRVFCHFPLE